MSARLLFALIIGAVTLAWAGSVSAVSISFIEPASETASILMSTDISGTLFTSSEFASLTVGGVTDSSTVLARVALTQPGSMHMEGAERG